MFLAPRWLAILLLTGAAMAAPATLPARTDASLALAAKYFLRHQSPDGAWRSPTYGIFRDGTSLTPFVLSCLHFMPQAGDEGRAAYRKGAGYLVGLVGPDGAVRCGPGDLNFPVYTAAAASRVVVLQDKTDRHLHAQAAWLKLLRQYQLNEALGWNRADPEYGGWGFAIFPPRKPPPGEFREKFAESNISATVFALAALRSAKVPADDPAYKQALLFVQRCQNFSEDPAQGDPRFDDGGFFFIPGDEVQNKAGVAGVDRLGRKRFHSYGTMTADGLRCLVRCGLPPEHPRVLAARAWLERHFDVKRNPGRFAPDREVLRDATYYYWAWAVAHAFMGLQVRDIQTPAGKVNWADALASELIARQRPDGSWVNRFTDAKEDDPLVSTLWAAAALVIARR